MTGARWMLRSYTSLSKMTSTKDEALTILTASIHENQNKKDNPVHNWKEPTLEDYRGYDPENLNVSEFMETDLLTAHRSDLAEMVLQLMKWKDFSHMPVEDKRGVLIGLISRVDLKTQLEKENNKPKPRHLQVKDVMQQNPLTLGPNESIQHALLMMKEYQLTCLPVVRSKELVGLLTESNCIMINKRLQGK
jgi:predicted transcriptional regulator